MTAIEARLRMVKKVDPVLKVLAQELTKKLKASTSVNWSRRESARKSRLRVGARHQCQVVRTRAQTTGIETIQRVAAVGQQA